MWYTRRYASTTLYPIPYPRRARRARSGSALTQWVYCSPLPNVAFQCPGTNHPGHCQGLTLQRSNRAQCHLRFPSTRTASPQPQIRQAPHHPPQLRCDGARAAAGLVTPESANLWPPHPCVDPGAGRRGLFCPRHHLPACQWRNDPLGHGPTGVRWKRAKHWITSPDAAYVRNKTDVNG